MHVHHFRSFKFLEWTTTDRWLRDYRTAWQAICKEEKQKPKADRMPEQQRHEEALRGVKLRGGAAGSCIKNGSLPAPLLQLLKDTVVEAVDGEIPGLSSASMRPMLMAAVEQSEYASVLKTPHNPAGWFHCSRSWIRKLWSSMGMRIRSGTTAAQKLPEDWEERLELWKLQIAYTVFINDIPPALVINVDQTGINLVPVGRRTLSRRGKKAIRLLGMDDKRQLTVVAAGAANGSILPFQAIFQGKTHASLPPQEDRASLEGKGWKFAATHNHWASLETSMAWIDDILMPYVERVRKVLGTPDDQAALLLLDCWTVHMQSDFVNHVKEASNGTVLLRFVPPNMTSKAQPMDVGIQKPLKDSIRATFTAYVAEKYADMKRRGVPPVDMALDLRIRAIRPLVPSFFEAAWDRLDSDRELCGKAWSSPGIDQCFQITMQRAAVQKEFEGKLFPAAAEEALEPQPTPEGTGLAMAEPDADEQLAEMLQAVKAARDDAAVVPELAADQPTAEPAAQKLYQAGRAAAQRHIVIPARGRGRGRRGGRVA
eukprot:363001-Chlamydomonas_euryale.AAC.1